MSFRRQIESDYLKMYPLCLWIHMVPKMEIENVFGGKMIQLWQIGMIQELLNFHSWAKFCEELKMK